MTGETNIVANASNANTIDGAMEGSTQHTAEAAKKDAGIITSQGVVSFILDITRGTTLNLVMARKSRTFFVADLFSISTSNARKRLVVKKRCLAVLG
mmetsp:Transcript_46451/g.97618  ORF Transcript_46451/g.97618 Transcript_46451/m.97618 type:complete len:97 (-) Transcript_46451:44-334(-)